jgi:hypothetical protein
VLNFTIGAVTVAIAVCDYSPGAVSGQLWLC